MLFFAPWKYGKKKRSSQISTEKYWIPNTTEEETIYFSSLALRWAMISRDLNLVQNKCLSQKMSTQVSNLAKFMDEQGGDITSCKKYIHAHNKDERSDEVTG